MWIDGLGTALILAAVPFFFAGTVGLLRFPDVYTRLHAVTKADNLGLGLLVASLALHSGSLATAARLFLIWAFVILASATACHLIARAALHRGIKPWRRAP